jgi:hypothetical protein
MFVDGRILKQAWLCPSALIERYPQLSASISAQPCVFPIARQRIGQVESNDTDLSVSSKTAAYRRPKA